MKFSFAQFFLVIATTASAAMAIPNAANDVFVRSAEAVPRTGPGYLDINFDGVKF